MIGKNIIKQGRNITLIGSFNPKIFHPEWFFINKLISEKEKESAEIKVMTNDIAVFTTEWLIIETLQERFSASAISDISYEQLRDLVNGTFELLNHTPVTMMGYNYDFDYQIQNREYWHQIGYFLSGKKYLWGKIFKNPGLRSLTIESPEEETIDFITRKTTVMLSPSDNKVCETGLHIHINDHFEVKDKEKCRSAILVETIIKERWDESQKMTEKLVNDIFQLIKEGIKNER